MTPVELPVLTMAAPAPARERSASHCRWPARLSEYSRPRSSTRKWAFSPLGFGSAQSGRPPTVSGCSPIVARGFAKAVRNAPIAEDRDGPRLPLLGQRRERGHAGAQLVVGQVGRAARRAVDEVRHPDPVGRQLRALIGAQDAAA